MTFVERHGIPPIGSGLSLGHILHLQHRPARRARRDRRVPRADGLRERPPDRPDRRDAVHDVHGAAAATTARSASPSTTTSCVELAGVDPTRLPPLDRRRRAGRTAAARRWPTELGLPASTSSCTPAMNDSHAGVVATGAFAPGPRPASRSARRACWSTRSTDYGIDLDHEVALDAGPVRRRYLVWAENGIGGKALEHVLDTSSTPTTSSATTSPTTPSPRSTRCSTRRTAGSSGVLFLPWLGGSLAPTAQRLDARRLRQPVARDRPRRPRARGRRGHRATTSRWLAPARRGVHRRSGIDEIAFVGGAARSRGWARCWPTCSTGRCSPLADPDRAVARAMALLALERHGELAATTSTRVVAVAADATSPTPRDRERVRRPIRCSSRPRSRRSARSARPSTHDRPIVLRRTP